MISVLNFGMGNLGSIVNMLRKVGAKSTLVETSQELEKAEKIILPGVGSFDHGMVLLHERGLVKALKQKVMEDRVPILGICLGMQLFGNSSEEGKLPGLSFIKAHCVKFNLSQFEKMKIPHMGWNGIMPTRESRILRGLDLKSRFYFVHSYHLVCDEPDSVLAESEYGDRFVSMVQKDNITGVQFHPEKSHRFGMNFLKNFSEL
jgi:glutamine amidotransferase